MDIETLLSRLERVRATGRGWSAKCPAHDGVGGTSLSIGVADDGRVLLHCFAGCGFREIATAIGLVRDDDRVEQPRRHAPAPVRVRPTPQWIAGRWHRGCVITDDDEAKMWCVGRGIDPFVVEGLDLARVLPRENRDWPRHRLVTRAWSATGRCESLHARATGLLLADEPKTRWPAGYAAAGLIFADGAGRQILEGAAATRGVSLEDICGGGRVLVVEGMGDFLSAASRCPDRELDMPAVFGVTAGGWTAAHGARIPRGWRVTIATDWDVAGEKYAQAIASTLRHCQVYRTRGTDDQAGA